MVVTINVLYIVSVLLYCLFFKHSNLHSGVSFKIHFILVSSNSSNKIFHFIQVSVQCNESFSNLVMFMYQLSFIRFITGFFHFHTVISNFFFLLFLYANKVCLIL